MKQRFSKRTRLVSALLTLAMVFTFLPFSAFADDDVDFWVPLHSENFPDKTFLEYIRTTFDKGGSEDGEPNGILEPGEWRAVTTIDVRNKNIISLWGITCFRNLKTLNCSDNQLTSLNLSYNTKLTQLRQTFSWVCLYCPNRKWHKGPKPFCSCRNCQHIIRFRR